MMLLQRKHWCRTSHQLKVEGHGVLRCIGITLYLVSRQVLKHEVWKRTTSAKAMKTFF